MIYLRIVFFFNKKGLTNDFTDSPFNSSDYPLDYFNDLNVSNMSLTQIDNTTTTTIILTASTKTGALFYYEKYIF